MPTIITEKQFEKVPVRSLCESCGAEFSCGANLGECWCFAVETPPEKLMNLREKFVNCLCEKCLLTDPTRPIR